MESIELEKEDLLFIEKDNAFFYNLLKSTKFLKVNSNLLNISLQEASESFGDSRYNLGIGKFYYCADAYWILLKDGTRYLTKESILNGIIDMGYEEDCKPWNAPEVGLTEYWKDKE